MLNKIRRQIGQYVCRKDPDAHYHLKCNLCYNQKPYLIETTGNNIVGFKCRFFNISVIL